MDFSLTTTKGSGCAATEDEKMENLASLYFNEDCTTCSSEDLLFFNWNENGQIFMTQFYPGGNKPQFNDSIYQEIQEKPPPRNLPMLQELLKVKRSKFNAFILFVGITGITLGLVGSTCYGLVQIPILRRILGPEYVVIHIKSSLNNGLFYGLELAAVTILCLLGILSNIFLVYGTVKKARYFFLPWLVFHVPLILGCLSAFVAVLILAEPIVNRLFAIIPLAFGLSWSFCWIIIVFEFYEMRRNMAKRIAALKYISNEGV